MAEPQQDRTIEFLSTPQAWGLPDGTKVERIDTHGAAVFLVGERVYKLKRAVSFPFMDFSTLERRQRFCADEVRLNRRTAPDLYLGLVPVLRDGDQLRLGELRQPDEATTDCVDWLVAMRRFDQDRLLARLAERGELPAALIGRLAEAIADFHAQAQPEPGHGGGQVLAHTVRMDTEQMLARGDLLDAALSEELARLMPAEAARVAKAADRRRGCGAVRRCHGDLHLKNIFLDGDDPLPFDGIEFNDRLSCIDTLYDLSFLLMDLDFRGLRGHANLALNRYLWRSAEKDEDLLAGLALLKIYLARRASIRAHVDAAGVPHIKDRAEADRQRQQARAYQRYARALFDETGSLMVCVGGLSGTGKTTIAMALAPELHPTPGAAVLRSDVLRKRMAGVKLDQRMPAGWYTKENSTAVYEEMHRLARIALAAGRSVVLDGVYARAEERAAAERVAREAGCAFAGLWLEAPADLLRARVAARQGDASDATPAVVERQRNYDLGAIGWTRIDASHDSAEVARRARAAIETGT